MARKVKESELNKVSGGYYWKSSKANPFNQNNNFENINLIFAPQKSKDQQIVDTKRKAR